jgi:uncharacterized small protein (DUF1192 family)
MSAPETHDPLVVNTKDGSCWVRRAVTREGRGLYALEGTPRCCPEYVLTSLAELAEIGLRAMPVDALPMPVGPEPQVLSVEQEREIRTLDLLGLMSDRVAPVISGHLAVLLAEIDRLRAERHSTNESVSLASEALRENRDRIAELEAGIAWRDAERERWADVHATVERAIDKGWSVIDTLDLEAELGPEPVAPVAEADGITQRIAPVQALREDPHDGPLAHKYLVPRDLPPLDGAQ